MISIQSLHNMTFSKANIDGVWKLSLDRHVDERGWFARCWCADEFESHGLNPRLVQCNLSFNESRGTLRGMHYQASPHGEDKLIRVTRGAICDVALDLRPDSPTYKQWEAFELTANNHAMLYLPQGIAHGFLTLTDETELQYLMSQIHVAEAARGVRWNDPAFAIDWPSAPRVISARDASFEDFTE